MSRAVGLALLLLVSVIKCLDQAAGKYVVLGGEAEETVVDSQLGKVHSRTSESGGKEVNFVFQVSRPDISTGPVAAFLLKVEAVHDFSNRSLSVIARTQDDMKKWEMPMETNVTVTMERVINLFNCLRDKNTTHVVISVSSLEPIQYQISLVSIPEFVVQVDQEVEVKGVGFLSPGLRYVDLNDVPKDALLRFEAHSPQIFSCARISLTPFFEKITTFPESSLEKGLFEAHQTMLGLAAFSLQRGHFGKGVLVKLVRVSDSSGVCDSNDLSKNPMSSSMKDFTFSLSDKPYGDTDFQMGIAAGCGALLCIVILSVTCFCVISQDPLISRRDKMQARDSCPCHGHLVPCSSRRSELKSENMDENNGLFKEENYLQVHNKTDLSWNNQQVSSLARPDSGIDSPTVNKEVSAFSAEIQKRANDGAVVEAAWSRQSERLPAISKGTSGVKFSVSELVIEETSSLELGESSSGCCSLSVDESHSVSSRHSSNHDPGGPHRDREIEPLYQAACQCNNGSGHEERLLKIMFKRSDLYVWLVLIMGVFYSLPAFQLVLGDQLHMKGAGNLDLCYYNFLCAVPALGLSDFNHTFSNLWYVVLGVLFILLTLHQSRNHNAKGDKKKRLKHSCYRKFRLELNESSTANNTSTDMDALGVSESTVQILPNQVSPSKEESDEVVGLPRHYGLFYAMGSALVFQGLLSTCYHLCPTKANFQFDATFMYVVATLCFMKIYQFRHSQHASAAYKVFAGLALIATLQTMGTLFPTSTAFWTLILVCYFILCLLLTSILYQTKPQVALDGRIISWVSNSLKSFIKTKKVVSNQRTSKKRLALIAFLNALNLGFLVFGATRTPEVGLLLFAIFMCNLSVYFAYYLGMKIYYCEVFSRRFVCLFLAAVAAWASAAGFYTRGAYSTSRSPAASRNMNTGCLLLGVYDAHDIWHMLSALAIYLSFGVLLVVDDGLESVPRDAIRIF